MLLIILFFQLSNNYLLSEHQFCWNTLERRRNPHTYFQASTSEPIYAMVLFIFALFSEINTYFLCFTFHPLIYTLYTCSAFSIFECRRWLVNQITSNIAFLHVFGVSRIFRNPCEITPKSKHMNAWFTIARVGMKMNIVVVDNIRSWKL